MMKSIALTVGTPDLDVEIEPRFGRAPFILLVDPDTMAWSSRENPARNAHGGAGIQVVQILDEHGVRDVISGEFGPKAHDALQAAGIRMHRCGFESTARQAVEALVAGGLGEGKAESDISMGGPNDVGLKEDSTQETPDESWERERGFGELRGRGGGAGQWGGRGTGGGRGGGRGMGAGGGRGVGGGHGRRRGRGLGRRETLE
jgi:predicted Fe-Mo cluster-binding NifX family protein